MAEVNVSGILKLNGVVSNAKADELNNLDGFVGNATDLNKVVGRNVNLTGADLNKFNTRRASVPFKVVNTEDLNRLNDGAVITDTNNDAVVKYMTVDALDITSLTLDDEVNATALQKVGDLISIIDGVWDPVNEVHVAYGTDLDEFLNRASSVVATDSNGKASIDNMTVGQINATSFAR